jgi:UPF0716 protein FxsA
MLAKLLLGFILVPLVEIMLFIEIGSRIGTWTTLLIIAVVAVLGAVLVRREGLKTWWRIQDKLLSGQMPNEELLDGLLVLVAGALLLTPGFFTDAVGFLLLLPPGRQMVKRWLRRRFSQRLQIQYREW